PDFISTVNLQVGLPDAVDMGHQEVIPLGSFAAQLRIALTGRMAPVSRRGNLQYFADRLDPVSIPMLIDIGVYDFSLRSSSAWAKKALAVRRMSLARRSSRFSRSNSLMRSRSLLVTPSRCPLSTSWRLTQVSSVCAEQPILGADRKSVG